jgi:hypothetical protein
MKRMSCFVVALVVACGPGGLDGSDDSSSAATTVDMGQDTKDSGNDGVECEPGTVWCEGECRVLSYDSSHCGECYHECQTHSGTGTCAEGYCTPKLSECLTVDDGFLTCAEYCASIGEQCGSGLDVAGNQCYGQQVIYNTPTCGVSTSVFLDPQVICDWPLPFGETLSGVFTVMGAECCCTQDNGA